MIKFQRKTSLKKINQIYIVINTDCNLKCQFCIRKSSNIIKKQLSLDEAKEVIHDIHYFFDNPRIYISGGEPCLHPQIESIIKLSLSHFNDVTLVSNGTITKKVEELAIKNPTLKFQISLDGPEEIHNKLRNYKAFKPAFESIRKLHNLKCDIAVSTTFSVDNYQYYDKIFKILSPFVTLKWKVSKEVPGGDAFQRISSHLSSRDWNELLNKIKVLTSTWPGKLIGKTNFSFIGKKINLSNIANKDLNSFGCQAGINRLYIYPNLHLIGCPLLIDMPLGDLKMNSFAELHRTDNYKRLMKLSFANDSKCYCCEYLRFCKGGCIGRSFLRTGSLEKGDPDCPRIFKDRYLA